MPKMRPEQVNAFRAFYASLPTGRPAPPQQGSARQQNTPRGSYLGLGIDESNEYEKRLDLTIGFSPMVPSVNR